VLTWLPATGHIENHGAPKEKGPAFNEKVPPIGDGGPSFRAWRQ
jgi:hypothetical protein